MKKVLFIFTLSFLIVFSLFSLTCINHSDSVNSQSNNSESVQWIFVNVKADYTKDLGITLKENGRIFGISCAKVY